MESPSATWNSTKNLTPAQRKKLRNRIIAGGKKADRVRKISDHHHASHEVPYAEKQIEKALGGISQDQKSTERTKKETPKLSFFQRLIKFFFPR